MVQETTDRHLPIYTSYSTFVTCLDWLKEMGTIPSRIDRSLWGSKFGGSVGAQLMPGLRFLGLLDGDVPTEGLDKLVQADNAGRKTLLRELLHDVYGVPLMDGLRNMTPKMLDEALTELGATDATRRKATSFLINAARAADIPIATHISKRARNRAAGKKVASNGRQRKREPESKPRRPSTPRIPSGDANSRTLKLRSGGRVSLTIDVNLFELAEDDKDFVLGLVARVREYETAQSGSREAADIEE